MALALPLIGLKSGLKPKIPPYNLSALKGGVNRFPVWIIGILISKSHKKSRFFAEAAFLYNVLNIIQIL
jgi:hypothetical protein